MKKFKLFIFSILLILISNKTLSIENKIEIKVDNEIITTLDIKKEIDYLQILNPKMKNLTAKETFSISKNSLIREKIKKKELIKNFEKIEVEEEILNQVFKSIYSEINLKSIDEFKNFLKDKGINYRNIKDKIKIEILWNRLIYFKYNKKINININEIKNQINNQKKTFKQYFLQEILFELKDGEKLENKFLKISEDINKNSFEKIALTQSISDSSKKEGNIGWVSENSLNNNILNEIKKIKVGNYTNPITIPGGFLILKIKDMKIIESNLDVNKELDRIIKEKTNQQLNQYSIIFYNKIKKDIIIDEI